MSQIVLKLSIKNHVAIGFFLASILLCLLCDCGSDDRQGNSNNGNDPKGLTSIILNSAIQTAVAETAGSTINNPLMSPQNNNDRANAQTLPNLAAVSGYVTRPGVNPQSSTQQPAYPVAWYRASLTARQMITLTITDDNLINDLDLGLFDESGQLVDVAVGTGKAKALAVPRSGHYFIRVQAVQSAAHYSLMIGQVSLSNAVWDFSDPCQAPPTVTTLGGWRLSDTFVPGDIIVRFVDKATDQRLEPQARAQSLGLAVRAGAAGRNMLLSLAGRERMSVYKALDIAHLAEQDGGVVDPDQQLKLDTLYAAQALNQRSDVLYAAPNFIRRTQFAPNDPLYSQQWHYPLINLPQAWDVNTGSGTIVVVLDTGVMLSHPDLQGQFVAGYDFVSDPANAGDGDGIDPDPTDPGDSGLPGGGRFHGTHIAGTVAAATHNAEGIAGIAFGAHIMPLRVMNQEGGTDYDIDQGVRFAARLPNDSGTLPPRRADVINLSLGGPDFTPAAAAGLQQARAAGVAIVAAAGNQASCQPFYPASYPGVLSVSAVGITKARASYSNVGPSIKVAAPGGDFSTNLNGNSGAGVLSTVATNLEGSVQPGYAFYMGTSMATAHMSGVVALMRSANPALTPLDIDNLLVSGALTEDLGQPGRDNHFGYGLIDAHQAVVAAVNTPGGQPITPVPILVVTPLTVNFDTETSSITLTISNGGGRTLTVNPPSENSGGWLRISATVDSNGLGNYTLLVDRANLPGGYYYANVTFTSNANSVQIPVTLQVADKYFDPIGIHEIGIPCDGQ